MIPARLIGVALLSFLAGCQSMPSGAPVSAVVETRNAPSAAELAAPTQVIVLGTGTPIPDAARAGSSIAVIHRGQAYLFDVGAGAVRNAVRARYRYDLPSLYPSMICCVFLTHMHSDHSMDYGELNYTLWWRRAHSLRAFGPAGLRDMTDNLHRMMAADTRLRASGNQPVPNPDGYKTQVTEIKAGVVFEDDGIRIEAFDVSHGYIRPAFGYRITTDDRVIVISGDTAYSETLVEMSRGADLLFHEVISDEGLATVPPFWQDYHSKAHTSAAVVGRIANEARPGTLVLYHGLYFGAPESSVVNEVRAVYDGNVILADDLQRF